METINKKIPLDFLDGASQNQACRGVATLYLSETHHFQIQMGLGSGTNKYVKISSLNLHLYFALEINCTRLQIFIDSMIVINWINKVQKCHNIYLNDLLVEIMMHLEDFDSFSYRHVCKETDVEADQLSEKGVNILNDQWKITKHQNGTYYEYYHR